MYTKPILFACLILKTSIGFAQEKIYDGNTQLENWFTCDSNKIQLCENESGLLEATIDHGYWACFGVTFSNKNLTNTTKLEVTLKGISHTSVKTTTVMFRWKDVNNIQTNDGTLPSNKNLLIGEGYQTFYTDYKNHLISSDGAFDTTKVNTLLIFIHFESYLIEEFSGKITVKEIRVF